MGYPTGEVQTAAMAVLRGDITLQGLLGNPANPPGGIYDAGGVPMDTPFPYITVEPITTQEGTLLVMGTDAKDVYLQTSAFTKYLGFSQARALTKQICSLFDPQRLLTLTGGFNNAFLAFDNAQELEDGDVGVRYVVARFKLYIQG